MDEEIQATAAFVARYLEQKRIAPGLKRAFQADLEAALRTRCSGHYDPSAPHRGNAYRSISFYNGSIDPVVLAAAESSSLLKSLSPADLASCFPSDLVVWTDPFSSSYRTGPSGQVVIIHQSANTPPHLRGVGRPSTPTVRGVSGYGEVTHASAMPAAPGYAPSESPTDSSTSGRSSFSPSSPDSFVSSSSYAAQGYRGGDYMESQYSTWGAL
ncbi:hypothetical protein DFJ74DRAFT_642767 [Hyaloraphidium curvatum]|nr:hypothetical protein DFJ74DRAFT_642767 [Hyaloraphidium curvatum]